MSPIAVEEKKSVNGVSVPAIKKVTSPRTTPTTSRYHSSTSASAIESEAAFAAHNYHPLPIVFARALGCSVWDPEGKEYLDFLSAYSAVNQGHCHPELIKALTEQASRLTLSSRAFYNDVFPKFAEFVTEYFGFDRVLPMNTGAEAVETAVKVARKWAYKKKGIKENEALVLGVADNFHGRTFAAISLSTESDQRDNYGPFVPNISSISPATGKPIPFNSIPAIRSAFESPEGANIAAIIIEPIQGEAGIIVPDADYLPQLRTMCTKHNILLVLDEIQTGIARTGTMLCHDRAGIKPDMVLLGKAISGGMYPVSCVLGTHEALLTVEPGTHGSTYGGNPLGCAVAMRALEVVRDEDMVNRAETLGKFFRAGLEELKPRHRMLKTVRGMGLLNAIVIDEQFTNGHTAWDLCLLMKERGVLAKPTHENIIRLAPPLVITEAQIRIALEVIGDAMAVLGGLEGKERGEGEKKIE